MKGVSFGRIFFSKYENGKKTIKLQMHIVMKTNIK